MICALPAEIKDRYNHSCMRVMIANAAPWSYALKQQYVADFPPESLFEVYGSTELGVDTVLLPQDQMRKPGSCGKPAPGIEIALLDEDGNEVTGTGPGQTGEVFVRSKGAFDAYYKNDASYQSNSRGDFHTVGDIAYWDDEGYLYICDRKTDMIISGGMNIYPAEIEAALEQHPEIYDVAVFGIPSEEWGEVVHATVVRSPGSSLTGEEIAAFAREHLASYKVPRSVDFTGELPRTGSGKLLKRQLRAPYWAGRSAQVGLGASRSASGALVAIAWRPRVSVEEPRLVREHHGLDAVTKVELLEDVRDVGLDGRVADVELAADLGVREAARDQAKYV
jgi:fatty-acyl-CoA synthase/long-chain acyl-CoA synthetase